MRAFGSLVAALLIWSPAWLLLQRSWYTTKRCAALGNDDYDCVHGFRLPVLVAIGLGVAMFILGTVGLMRLLRNRVSSAGLAVCVGGLALALLAAEGLQRAFPWDLYAEGGVVILMAEQLLASLAIIAVAAGCASALSGVPNVGEVEVAEAKDRGEP